MIGQIWYGTFLRRFSLPLRIGKADWVIFSALSLVILVLDLGGKVVADVTDVSDLVLHDEGHLGAHGESDLEDIKKIN